MALKPSRLNSQQNVLISRFYLRAPRPSARCRDFFYIIWKLIYVALFWAVALNFWVPPSWLKMDFKSIFSLFLDLRPF